MNKKTEQAPSIGSVDLGYDPKGNRVRQIYSSMIHNPNEIMPILHNAHTQAEQYGATRSIVRTIVHGDALSNITTTTNVDDWVIEGTIPLSGDLSNYYFTYLARNHPDRTTLVEQAEQDLLKQVFARPVKQPAEILRKTSEKGFKLEFLQGTLDQLDFRRLQEMYRLSFASYPFDIGSAIVDMVKNPDVHVCVARSTTNGLLYAVSATEIVVLPNGFSMREMGDSAKMPEVNGLNAPLKLALISQAVREGGVDVLFTETRAALGAVNAINYSIGMNHCGLLRKHTVISGPQDVDEIVIDGPNNGRLGNMNVWALNRTQMNNITQQIEETMRNVT